jgi:hypothetical protein
MDGHPTLQALPTLAPAPKPAYLFLDEGGGLNFSRTGTKYFTLTSVMMFRPFPIDAALAELRFDFLERGLDIEYFHAAEDRQATRDKVFAVIESALDSFRVDSVVVEKRKTGPALRVDRRFYPEMMGYLLRYVISKTELSRVSQIIAITDRIPINRKRQAIEKAVKTVLANMLPVAVRYRVLHHASKSCAGLQIADYFNWAIFRAWERADHRSLSMIRGAVRSQFDIFATGSITWY